MRSPIHQAVVIMSAKGEINQDAADRLLSAWEEEKKLNIVENPKKEPKWKEFIQRNRTNNLQR